MAAALCVALLRRPNRIECTFCTQSSLTEEDFGEDWRRTADCAADCDYALVKIERGQFCSFCNFPDSPFLLSFRPCCIFNPVSLSVTDLEFVFLVATRDRVSHCTRIDPQSQLAVQRLPSARLKRRIAVRLSTPYHIHTTFAKLIAACRSIVFI